MGVSKKEISPCPIDVTLSVIDGRWKSTILWRLLGEPRRTNELRKSIPEITERMLLRHLRDMTGAGILERHQEQGLPLRVRYSPYAVRTDVGPGLGCSLFVGQRTFETRSLYLILAEMLFTLPAANEMLPLHPFQWKNILPWHLGTAAKVRILRFKNLPPLRHDPGLQNHV